MFLGLLHCLLFVWLVIKQYYISCFLTYFIPLHIQNVFKLEKYLKLKRNMKRNSFYV